MKFRTLVETNGVRLSEVVGMAWEEYVTHMVDENGGLYSGHYFNDPAAAARDFANRVGVARGR